MSTDAGSIPATGIAVIGLAGRFPGAPHAEEFWENLRNGVESIRFLDEKELASRNVPAAAIHHPEFIPAVSELDDIDQFDAAFFGFNPREAQVIDPQQRLFLEAAWQALEDAGHDPRRFPGPIGVFAGVSPSEYRMNVFMNREAMEAVGSLQALISNDKDYLATRVSYKMDLRGPSLTTQTACSTSLVATHLACQSLLTYQCDMALAGGVTAKKDVGYVYKPGMIMSPDGHCRPFDAKAKGTIFGSGLGVIVLKRLEDAIADGDFIRAVIRSSAINNDGSDKVGFTAPSVDGQSQVIASAYAMEEIDPASVTYIEAHGTGTELGDPLEMEALSRVFSRTTDRKQFCAVGSVKSNIGHLDAAAGISGLIKTVLALQHREIPPSLHFETPNPQISFDDSPFFVNSKLRPWTVDDGEVRRAGVSSFGIGGTNAHIVLEEAPSRPTSPPARGLQVLPLSARTSTALSKQAEQLASHLERNPAINLADVARTLQLGRKEFEHRRVILASTVEEAVTALREPVEHRVFERVQNSGNRRVVFLFSGQGSQYAGMASEWYEHDEVFRKEFDRCHEVLAAHDLDLRGLVFATGEAAAAKLQQTEFTQPALFAVEYALAHTWMARGVSPDAMIGHSIGEYVAACLAGVFSLETALAVVVARGRAMQVMDPGDMLAVPLAEAEVRGLLSDGLAIAAVNGPQMCVVSGPSEAVTKLRTTLEARQVSVQPLHTSHAFHSGMMDGCVAPVVRALQGVELQAPNIPYLSNVTGEWITPEQATSAEYYGEHLRNAVRFSDAVREVLKDPSFVFLEVGPGKALLALTRLHLDRPDRAVLVQSLRHPSEKHSDDETLAAATGQLWLAGVSLDWEATGPEGRQRVSLPTYPFERERYWVTPDDGAVPGKLGGAGGGKLQNIADWYYQPVWKQSPPAPKLRRGEAACWLVFADGQGLSSGLRQRLIEEQHTVLWVEPGDGFEVTGETVRLRPDQVEDYRRLLDHIGESGAALQGIVHCWGVTDPADEESPNFLETCTDRGFYSLVSLARALFDRGSTEPISLHVVTNRASDVTGEEGIRPEKALFLGPCKVIPLEMPPVACCQVDVSWPANDPEALLTALTDEVLSEVTQRVVAYRGRRRWSQTFEPIHLEPHQNGTPRIREEGTYLITGGLGGIGLVLAEYLAEKYRARLVLLGRSAMPPREQWAPLLAESATDPRLRRKIETVQRVEDLGGKVLVVSADVGDEAQLRQAVRRGKAEFGDIHGVIHAAGIAGGGMVALKTREIADPVLSPKVQGTMNLHRALEEEAPDFFVLCSSITAVTGDVGQVDYCAANLFLDSFAAWRSLSGQGRTLSLNWDAWQEVGMAVDTEVPEELRQQRQIMLATAISSTEGQQAFDQVLHAPLSQVTVYAKELAPALEKLRPRPVAAAPQGAEAAAEAKERSARPNLPNPYVAPDSETQRTLAGIWEDLLGFEGIGVNDNFFELGGHSLLATQVISRIRSQFQVELPLGTIFESPTVAALSEQIEGGVDADSADADREEIDI